MLKTEKLTAKYETQDKENIVLSSVDLAIKKGEFVAILGHNGSGKSTLAKHFNAIMIPYSGKVFVDDMDTADESRVYEIRQKTGMVFQNPDNQMVSSIVEDDVAFAPENLGVPADEIRKRVDFALKAVGMYEHRHKTPQFLSGGQKQRIAIAGIIAMHPEYIVLDEPTAMLDPAGRAEVMETLEHLNQEQGLTVVLITHFMNEASRADRVIVLDQGKVLMDGAPKEVFTHVEQLRKIGLDVPPAAALMHALKEAGCDIRSDALSTDECAADLLAFFKEKGVYT